MFDVNGVDYDFVIFNLELISPPEVRYHSIFILPEHNSERVKRK